MFRIWIGNLGKYNEGILLGEWVDLPCYDFNEVFDRIGINEQYEETFIADYDNNFGVEVGEFEDLAELNELAEQLEGIDEDESVIEAIMGNYYYPDDGLSVLLNGSYTVYQGCDTMSDVVYQSYEESGQLKEIEEVLPSYFVDWEAIANTWEIEGTFISYDDGYIEIWR